MVTVPGSPLEAADISRAGVEASPKSQTQKKVNHFFINLDPCSELDSRTKTSRPK